ncbi:plastocyanin/azurin family copper-binding protein [Halosimplex sp. TS25]|uniref:plastocyanin/azurin family copper-binding protein n=1 Tax=Halosimplex rarum TaxID=3396619 RepID=UPI0039E81C04
MSQENLESSRRDVMKAVGAGTVLTALGGTAVVSGRDGRAVGEVDAAAVEHDDRLQQAGSVHTVETLISGPPTNPERPADFFYQPTGLHVQPGDVIRFEFVTPDHNVVSYHPAFGMRRRVPLGVDAISAPLKGYRPDSIPGDMVDPPMPAAEEGPGGTATATPGGEATTPMETETPTDTGTATGTDGGSEGPVPDYWLLALDEPGVYDFLCSPHEVFGMAMRVVVGDETDADFETEDAEALPEPRVGPVGLARVTLTDPALAPENIVEQGSVEWSALEANQGGGGEGTATETPTAETETAATETENGG